MQQITKFIKLSLCSLLSSCSEAQDWAEYPNWSLKRGRSTGVCEVSVLETSCIVGSTDKRPEVPGGGQNRGYKQLYKNWVASLAEASSPDSPPHQLWPDPPVQEDLKMQSFYIIFVAVILMFFITTTSPCGPPFSLQKL